MKKLFLYTLCLLMLATMTGCRRNKEQDVPAPNPNQNQTQNGNGSGATDNMNGGTGNSQNSGTTNDFGSNGGMLENMGESAQNMVDGAQKAVRELWDDMKITAANLTDLPDTDADALLEEWGLDKTLLEDYTVKRYSDGEGGRMILARVKAGHAAEVASALQAKGVDAKVWENGNYVLIADTDRAQDIVTRFQALNF